MDPKKMLKQKIPVLALVALVFAAALLYSLTGCATARAADGAGDGVYNGDTMPKDILAGIATYMGHMDIDILPAQVKTPAAD